MDGTYNFQGLMIYTSCLLGQYIKSRVATFETNLFSATKSTTCTSDVTKKKQSKFVSQHENQILFHLKKISHPTQHYKREHSKLDFSSEEISYLFQSKLIKKAILMFDII